MFFFLFLIAQHPAGPSFSSWPFSAHKMHITSETAMPRCSNVNVDSQPAVWPSGKSQDVVRAKSKIDFSWRLACWVCFTTLSRAFVWFTGQPSVTHVKRLKPSVARCQDEKVCVWPGWGCICCTTAEVCQPVEILGTASTSTYSLLWSFCTF